MNSLRRQKKGKFSTTQKKTHFSKIHKMQCSVCTMGLSKCYYLPERKCVNCTNIVNVCPRCKNEQKDGFVLQTCNRCTKRPHICLSKCSSGCTKQTEVPHCECDKQCVRRQSKKMNENRGRHFYTCTDNHCGFFQWV